MSKIDKEALADVGGLALFLTALAVTGVAQFEAGHNQRSSQQTARHQQATQNTADITTAPVRVKTPSAAAHYKR